MKRYIWLLTLTFFTIVWALVLFANMPKPIRMFENAIKDSMFVFRGKNDTDKRIAIIDIDEKSLKTLGQWPWSRNVLAKILDNLTQAGALIIGLDVIFTEEDKSSPSNLLKKLDLNISNDLPNYDTIFAKSLKRSPTITAFMFSTQNDGVKTDEKEPETKAFIIEKNKPKKSFIPTLYRPVLNIDILDKSAFSSGFINYAPTFDKVVRDVPAILNYKDVLYPSLSLEIFRLISGAKNILVQYNENGVEFIVIGKVKIPTDIYGNIKVNFMAPHPAYPYISAVDIYNKNFTKSDIEGKVLFLGTSVAGLYDLRSSPFDASVPGVEVHASLIDNLINQNFISSPQWGTLADLIFIFILPILCFFTLFKSKVSISTTIGLFFILFTLISHYILMFYYGIVFHTTILLLEIIFIYLAGTIINYIFEVRQKEFIKTKFAKKVSREVMEDIVKDGGLTLKGDTKEISIFFSDIRRFTTISESLNSPKILIDFLNSYMTPMTNIIIKNKGTVDKFIGDAIMAYWNAPKELKNHADFALKSAIEQIEALKDLNQNLKNKNLPSINIGIGLNVGHCIVGEMGSEGRSDYTCIGDSVNLASRLESLNKKYNTNIILSEYFLEKLSNPNAYIIEELGDEIVKGKSQSVKIFTCKGYF